MPGSRERLVAMEGMRGFAAILVFFVHFDALFRPYFRPDSFVAALAGVAGSFGHTGVDLFFVLSGFLIYGIVMKQHPSYLSFIWRRIRRLYPVFLLVLSLYLGLSIAFPSNSRLPASFPRALMYIGANLLMLPGMTAIPAIITVSWSLSYEWFFYLTIPFVIAIFRLRSWMAWQRVAFFILLAIVECVLWLLGMSGHIRLILFASGIILWELVDEGVPRILSAWLEYVVTATFILSILAIGLSGAKQGETVLVLSKVPHFYAPLLFVSLPLFSLYAMFFDGFLGRIFSWDCLRWMGNISYSYYLIHGLALHGVRLVVNHFFPPAPRSALFDVLLLVVCVSFTILCASLLFVVVEKPLSWPKTTRNYRGGGYVGEDVLTPVEVARTANASKS
jgi:exopolysaccharide production protein ExoZ